MARRSIEIHIDGIEPDERGATLNLSRLDDAPSIVRIKPDSTHVAIAVPLAELHAAVCALNALTHSPA